MPGHDVIVIGGSAGSLEPLTTLVEGLPPDLPAAVCVTRHTSPHARNMVPLILSKAGTLPATEAVDGEPLRAGHIYVAPPDYHLVVISGSLRVSRSATENRFRPAIDPLFRSAAVAYGPRVVGVLLSGGQDDGTAGLWAVKQQGGIAVIQDPHEAQHPSMPRSAQTYVPVDYCLPAADLAPLLVRLAHEPVTVENTLPVSEELLMETHIALQGNALESGLLKVGQLTPYTCPTCHGALLQLKAGRFVRFRCHTGHAYSARSFLAELRETIDDALWNTLRALDESVLLMTHMAEHLRQEDPTAAAVALFTAHAQEAQQQAHQIRQMVMQRPIVPSAETQETLPGADELTAP
jgi:two-component system, chemotaxis family, protein-glutamate methylesterase/glutaminase